MADTSKPNLEKSIKLIIPTPPVTPETNTLPSSGFNPCFKSFLKHKPAVNPAVPKAIDSERDKLSGFFTIQSSGTLMYSPNPP